MTEPTTIQRIRIAAFLVAGQVGILIALAIAELVSLDTDHPSVALTTALFYALFAAGLGFAAWGFAALHSWSRGPVVLAQLIAMGVGWSFKGGSTVWVTGVLFVWAIAVLAIVFSPSTTTALYGHRGGDDEDMAAS